MITAITVQCVIEIWYFGRLTCEKKFITAEGPILSGTQLSNFALIKCNEHFVGCAHPLLRHNQCKYGANSFLCCSIFLGSVKDGPAVTDRTCCHVKLQFTFKWPYKKLCKSLWLHLWTVMDQIKANAILAVLQYGTLHRQIILALGFKLSPGWGRAQDHSKCENRTWSKPPHFPPRWKLTIRRNSEWWCILYFLHLTDQDQVSSRDHALAKRVTELWMGTTVKHRLLI